MISSSSGVSLEAEVSGPGNPSFPCLVLAHPHPQMGGTMHHKIIDTLFRRSSERGWGVVRFNFRGVGASTGVYDSGAGEKDDLLSVLQFASEEFSRPIASITLVGYSFGSWVSSKAAASLPELGRLILIAPPVKVMDFSALRGVTCPKDVFAAGLDEVSPWNVLEPWFLSLSPPKSIHLYERADHGFTGSVVKLVLEILGVVEPG